MEVNHPDTILEVQKIIMVKLQETINGTDCFRFSASDYIEFQVFK